jgi:hypothetical protein
MNSAIIVTVYPAAAYAAISNSRFLAERERQPA